MTPVALSVERDGTMTVRLSLDDRRALERVLARWTSRDDTDPRALRLVTLWRLVRVEPEPSPPDPLRARRAAVEQSRWERGADPWPDPQARPSW
jgi:hypothetical protein